MTFAALHTTGFFVMPNAFDAGVARRLEAAGFPALATTSSGHAATLGTEDQQVTRDELLRHVELLVRSVAVPLSVDAELCFPRDPGGVTRTVELLAGAGAAGLSVEDYDPAASCLVGLDEATERVAAVCEAAHRHGLVVTARCESALYGAAEDPVQRLAAYRDAGADVLFAPLLNDEAAIASLVALGRPVNVLAAGPGLLSTARLRDLGVRRVSTGGSLTWAAYDAAVAAAAELRPEPQR